jgi:uncharacterized membrane protein YbhN (UPF0104 family)
MSLPKRSLVGWGRLLLPPVLLAFLGWHFYRSFKSLEESDSRALIASIPAWSWIVCAGLYLAGILASAAYWRMLMAACGHSVPPLAAGRAFLVSQMGKYVPGKGLALLIRAGMVRDLQVPMTIGLATGMIEVLWTMAVGSMLALIVACSLEWAGGFAVSTDPWLVPKLLAIVAITLVPAWPSWSIRLARASARRLGFDAGDNPFLFSARQLASGAMVVALGWLLLSMSLIALIEGIAPGSAWKLALPALAWVPLANVGGFIASTPGGLGVREYLLQQALLPELGPERALLASLLLRIVWTVAEVASALVMWLLWRKKIPASARGTS